MNKYITALFVVLATAGVEAQIYHSALKAALDKYTIEEICHQIERNGTEAEVLSIIEIYKKAIKTKQKGCHYKKHLLSLYKADIRTQKDKRYRNNYKDFAFLILNETIRSAIIIRAPSYA